MKTASWAIPVGILAGIVVCGFIFFCFWFPRAWQHGVNSDHAEVQSAPHGLDREAQRQRNRAIIERFSKARARERGEVVDDSEDEVEMATAPRQDTKAPVGQVTGV